MYSSHYIKFSSIPVGSKSISHMSGYHFYAYRVWYQFWYHSCLLTTLKLVWCERNISSVIFGSLHWPSENVRERSCGLRTMFEESSEIFRKWSEIFGASSSVCLYNNKNNTWLLTDLARVVHWIDNAIHWINHYPTESMVCFNNTYPLDNDLSAG